jgi:hypothetical protein
MSFRVTLLYFNRASVQGRLMGKEEAALMWAVAMLSLAALVATLFLVPEMKCSFADYEKLDGWVDHFWYWSRFWLCCDLPVRTRYWETDNKVH